MIIYESSSTYTWWDIEDGVGPLAAQAVARWESLGLPKDAAENPVITRVWVTDEDAIVYTTTLFYGGTEVYTAEGLIKISGVPQKLAAEAAEGAIDDSVEGLVGRSAADDLVKGLRSWLSQ